MTSSASPRPRRRVAGERSRPSAAPAAVATLEPPRSRATGGDAPPAAPAPPAPAAGRTADAPSRRDAPARRRWPVALGALALGLVALVLAVVLWVQGAHRADAARSGATAAAAARTAVETMLSYDYKTFDQHTATVGKLLTGGFRSQFAAAASQSVKPLAVRNQAVVRARASEVGVMSSGPGTVRVLAFVDQTTTSARLSRPQLDQNRVILTMTRVGERWLVSRVEAF